MSKKSYSEITVVNHKAMHILQASFYEYVVLNKAFYFRGFNIARHLNPFKELGLERADFLKVMNALIEQGMLKRTGDILTVTDDVLKVFLSYSNKPGKKPKNLKDIMKSNY